MQERSKVSTHSSMPRGKVDAIYKNQNHRQPAAPAVYNPYIIHGRSYPALCSGPLVFHVKTAIRAGYQHHDKCFPKTTGGRGGRENER
ncbi:uncharacterized protein BO80DRAFT_269392 [Aspergillus ibericus CBS 121593]|uniref:Uncharacterized protein n=1 Tax=Aspergillus ibericus CBS 121593 TaxID=1448316 RepID=A0A395H858_9EURO|nr:hypothetical protein BO80DRAFT_269392 [Aspergillus ibericus CBS 121593]RAL03749.1 hypothetical protein BO80DRAFT_269392 [Aspergillus ibericus CBS 121593]